MSDQLSHQEQVEYRARQLRELLLHRYLDYRYKESLNDHGKYFERNIRGSRASENPSSARRTRKKKYLEARAIYASRRSPKVQSSPVEYEESIRKAARRLAEDLIHAYVREKQLEEDRNKAERQMHPKSGRRRKKEKDESSRSEDTSENGKSPQEATKHVTVVAPCEEDEKSTEGTSHRQEEEKASSSEHKSILKQEAGARTPKKPPRPYTAVMVSSHKRRGRGGPTAPEVYDKKREAEYSEQFTYSYLAALLHTLRCDDIPMTTPSFSDQMKEKPRSIPMRPKTAPNRPNTSRPGRRLRKPGKEEEEDKEKKQKEEGDKSPRHEGDAAKERRKDSGRSKSSPQVRPGSQPIKCNWDPSKSHEAHKPEIKVNPAKFFLLLIK